jgi:hypothetical protein
VYEKITETEASIGIKIPTPIAVIVSAAITAIVTIIKLIPDFTDDDEKSKEAAMPQEDRVAPRFAIYYMDESGVKQPLPVMREGQTPESTQEFYIRPHGTGQVNATSNVRFYFVAGTHDASGGATAAELSFQFSPEDPSSRLYENGIGSGAEEGGDSYFEIKKHDGYRGDGDERTSLTIKVVNSAATTDSENPVYFPRYYVNDQMFTEGDGFVIHFLDRASAADLEQVLIPEHITPLPTKVLYFNPYTWEQLKPVLTVLKMGKAA